MALAAAGPGGASQIFVFWGLLAGLAGTAVHGLLAFWKHRRKAILLWSIFSLALFSYLYVALFGIEQSCWYTSQEARELLTSRLVKYNKSRGPLGGLDPQYLRKITTRPSCPYYFLYEGKDRKLMLIMDRDKLSFEDLNEQ